MFSFKVLWDLRIVACRSVGRLVLRIRFGSDESKKMILFYPQSRNFSLNGTKVFLKYCGLMKVEQDNSKNVIRGQFHFMLFHKKIIRYFDVIYSKMAVNYGIFEIMSKFMVKIWP